MLHNSSDQGKEVLIFRCDVLTQHTTIGSKPLERVAVLCDQRVERLRSTVRVVIVLQPLDGPNLDFERPTPFQGANPFVLSVSVGALPNECLLKMPCVRLWHTREEAKRTCSVCLGCTVGLEILNVITVAPKLIRQDEFTELFSHRNGIFRNRRNSCFQLTV